MVLNFRFFNWSPACALDEQHRQDCITRIAVHEFGHALGFDHEHNRRDSPSSCKYRDEFLSGDLSVGSWDLHSVMNYCNPVWDNGGKLSLTDIAGVRRFYGPPPRPLAAGRIVGATSTTRGGLCGAIALEDSITFYGLGEARPDRPRACNAKLGELRIGKARLSGSFSGRERNICRVMAGRQAINFYSASTASGCDELAGTIAIAGVDLLGRTTPGEICRVAGVGSELTFYGWKTDRDGTESCELALSGLNALATTRVLKTPSEQTLVPGRLLPRVSLR
jgi:hypothetical protein